jgi:hypothetical protein
MYKKITLAALALSLTGCLFGETSIQKSDSSSTAPALPACTNSGTGNCQISQATVALLETNLIAANIMNGVSIFGVTGTYTGPSAGLGAMISNMHREKGTAQWSMVTESSTNKGLAYTNSNSGYRAVPDITKDDDGYKSQNVIYVDRTGWGATPCGTVQATIDARIANCSTVLGAEATWDGTVKGNAGQSVWKLVSRTGDVNAAGRAREVWRDEKTGLLWSSLVSGAADNKVVKTNGGTGGGTSVDDNTYINWCKASGSNNITNNPTAQPDSYNDPVNGLEAYNYCDNASYQNVGTGPAVKAVSACFEDGENFFTTVDPNIDNAGKAGLNLASTPSVAWRLATKYDYQQADNDGIRNVLQEMGPNTYNYEWSASVSSDKRNYAWIFYPNFGVFYGDDRVSSYAVRCVGR